MSALLVAFIFGFALGYLPLWYLLVVPMKRLLDKFGAALPGGSDHDA